MKKLVTILFLILVALLVVLPGCQPDTPTTEEATLTVADGTTEVTYTRAELRDLAATEVVAEGETYVGVRLAQLLGVAGVDPATASEVTAVAVDDFSATYTPEQVNRPDTIVAYARQDGDLAEDEQPFRMVLPNERGQLNVRMISRIEVVQ